MLEQCAVEFLLQMNLHLRYVDGVSKKISRSNYMKLNLKVLFAAIVIAQSFFALTLKAKESSAIDTNCILACGECDKGK